MKRGKKCRAEESEGARRPIYLFINKRTFELSFFFSGEIPLFRWIIICWRVVKYWKRGRARSERRTDESRLGCFVLPRPGERWGGGCLERVEYDG